MPTRSISETNVTIPQISSTVGHATSLTAAFAEPGEISDSTVATVSAVNPTSSLNTSAPTASAAAGRASAAEVRPGQPRAKAAIELLESAGWAVELASGGCCGRSSLSKGLLDDAKKKATGLVTSLARDTEPGSPIVGCEPSCVFTLRDETLALLPELPEARQVKERVRQVEELLVEAIDDGRLKLPERSWLSGRRVVFHGHCHQKAEVGTAATMALLRRIPGLEVAEIDSGCCGMAGSFGFEAEHYETSMAVGRDRLFPALEKEPEETLVAATGVSCRQQIFDGAGRTAWHPLELVREALGGS